MEKGFEIEWEESYLPDPDILLIRLKCGVFLSVFISGWIGGSLNDYNPDLISNGVLYEDGWFLFKVNLSDPDCFEKLELGIKNNCNYIVNI